MAAQEIAEESDGGGKFGAVAEKWDGRGRIGKNSKEVFKDECDGVFGGERRVGTAYGEKINGVGDAGALGEWHIAFVITVVVENWTDVKTVYAVFGPTGTLVGAIMDDDLAASRSHRGF